MNDENALLRAIATHPDEDTPRLAFADFLEERGNPDRAAFIRGQIEYARLKEDSLHRRELAFKCRQLLEAHEEEWLDPRDAYSFDWNWSRGFVETFTTTPPDLDQQDAELFRTNPFRRVWIWELEGNVDGLELIPTDNRITALDLIGNKLNVRQLKKLAKMTHFTHLRELGLMFNDLRDTSVKVLREEPFFQRLDLIRLGANPLTDRGREQLRAHFGDRVSFAHERDSDRLYTIQDDYLRVGWGRDFTQFLMIAGEELQRVAVFDHAGSLIRTEERTVTQPPDADYKVRAKNSGAVSDAWLAELGDQSATIKVRRFQLPDGAGITPFNWWADVFDGREAAPHDDMAGSVHYWLEEGKFRFCFGGWRDIWLNRQGEVTDT